MVGIVGCNWDGNTSVNIMDYSYFVQQNGLTVNDDGYDVGFNLDRNTAVNIMDYSIYSAFVGLTSSDLDGLYADTIVQ